jgi:hypothetical protein
MTYVRLLPAALLGASLLASPAHADPTGLDNGFVLQGSVSYDCLGCASGATFSGVSTFVRNGAVVTLPTTGSLTVQESCESATGGAYGTVQIGADAYQVSWTRAAGAVAVTAHGPGDPLQMEIGPGTFVLDAPPGTCGIPVTATLTAPLVSFYGCACLIAGDNG